LHTDDSIVDVLAQLKRGLPPQPSKIRNRGYGGAGKKLKNVEYCAVLEQTDFVSVGKWVVIASHGLEIEQLSHAGADVGSIKLWRHSKFYNC